MHRSHSAKRLQSTIFAASPSSSGRTVVYFPAVHRAGHPRARAATRVTFACLTASYLTSISPAAARLTASRVTSIGLTAASTSAPLLATAALWPPRFASR